MLRTFTVIPTIVYFIGLSLKAIYSHNNRYKKLLLIGTMILIFISSVYEIRTYFVHQSVVFKEAFEAQHELKYYLTDQNLL